MAQSSNTPPSAKGYEVEFIPFERRMDDRRRAAYDPLHPTLPPGVPFDRRKQQRRTP